MFYENLLELCAARGISLTALCREVGLSHNAPTRWKTGSIPQAAILRKIADFFGVTPSELLGKEKSAVIVDSAPIRMIPLYESVSAGLGAHAENRIIDRIPVTISSDAEAAETIALKVQGDSMYPKIEDGDTIIVHRQESVDSGTIAVVLLDEEEGLVKRVEYGVNWITLHSFNPMYPPLRFKGADVLRLQVVGRVTKIIKEV